MIRWLCLLSLALVVAPAYAGKEKAPKKPKKGAPPIVGWHQPEGASFACYHPEDFGKLGVGDRRIARQNVLKELMTQWQGARGDGVSFDENEVTGVETILLGRPELIETISAENRDKCVKAQQGAGTGDWGVWLTSLAPRLNEGQCMGSLLPNTLFHYLNIGTDWQIPTRLCEGDAIRISISEQDMYRISDDGPWINANGDTSKPASGDLPCTLEGCYPGQVILRFIDDKGVTKIIPVGTGIVFKAPAHGRLAVMINDTTYYDNTYKTVDRITHHASVEYRPAGGP